MLQAARVLLVASSWTLVASYVLVIRQNEKKMSVLGLSCDFVAYSWLLYLASFVLNCGYLTNRVAEQYSERYPLYPTYDTIVAIVYADFFGLLATSLLMHQTFRKYRKTRNTEALSPQSTIIVFCMFVFYMYFFAKWVQGHSMVNALDMVNILWGVGVFAFGVRLIAQCLNNWFYLKVAVMHRHFLLWQLGLLALALLGTETYRHQVPWHYVPTNAPVTWAVATNVVALVVIVVQSRLYRTLPI